MRERTKLTEAVRKNCASLLMLMNKKWRYLYFFLSVFRVLWVVRLFYSAFTMRYVHETDLDTAGLYIHTAAIEAVHAVLLVSKVVLGSWRGRRLRL